MNLLATSVNFISFSLESIKEIDLNWIGKAVGWIIESVGIIGVGIILFTLILKTIVLPLDIYSKYKTKKQSLLMEQMRPQMEKLQKQYADNNAVYSQKVQELYKKNGYSMMGACLPTIVSLVIFMVIFTQFSTYSQYANLELYNGMVESYNTVVETYEDSNVYSEENPVNGFLIEATDVTGRTAYYVDFDAFVDWYEADRSDHTSMDPLPDGFDEMDENDKMNVVKDYIRDNARYEAALYYYDNVDGFLWVKSIWYPDSMLNKEVPEFSDFQSSLSRASIDDNYEESYNEVTYYLVNVDNKGDTYNGYFVLIVLAIGMMLLSQFVSMRMQKGINDLSTVDGSGARTNKWMMIIMPIMYGIFSFFYSAAFSIYMITNTTYSLLTTLIINKALNVKFKKLEEQNELDRYLHKSAEKKNKKKIKRK